MSMNPVDVATSFIQAVQAVVPSVEISSQKIVGGGIAYTIPANNAFNSMVSETLVVAAKKDTISLSLENNAVPVGEATVLSAADFNGDLTQGVMKAAQELTGFSAGPQ